MDSLVNGSKWDLLCGIKLCLLKIAYQVTRTRVLTVLARLIQLEISGLSEESEGKRL